MPFVVYMVPLWYIIDRYILISGIGDNKMKERSFMVSLGILLYVVLSLTDRFFYKIPNHIYIPLMVLGIVVIIAGFVIDKKKNKK